MKIVTSWMEVGIEQGEKKFLLRMLTKKCGMLSPELRQQIKSLPSVQVEELGDVLFELESMDDVTQWVRDNGNG